MNGSRWASAGIVFAAFAFGLGVLAAGISGDHTPHPGVYTALALAIGWGFTGTGLYVLRRRRGNRIGLLMIAVGFSGMLKALAFADGGAVLTIGTLGQVLIFAVLVHLLLSFPSGHLEGRLDRVLVAAGYFNTTVVHAAAYVEESSQAGAVIATVELDLAIASLGAVVAVLYRRWRASTPGQRRAYAPVLAGGALTFTLLLSDLVVQQSGLSSGVSDVLTLALFSSIALLPVAFLLGLVRFRFGQAEAISSLVGRLGGGRTALRDALAEALGDPGVELAYWVPSQDAYVDAAGHPMRIDAAPEGKVATVVEHEGRRVGAIVHEAFPEEEQEHVRAVAAAAALTLENERLGAELRAKLEELRASRARIVTAGDVQRRRLERDLHDGAQQRLMALGIDLRMARDSVRSNPDEAVELLESSVGELNEATRELRELARGIHPAVLTERGLRAALNGLADRSPVPVELVTTPDGRLPMPVESAVYFVVAEALTNVARYADAQVATVTVMRENGHVDVEVCDDGVGGADPDRGSGLRGLSDRLAALDGRLDLTSADGQGTTVRARIPCE